MIDPEFFSDEEVGSWSIAARLFYIGLWSCADDEGRFKSNSRLLKAQIFPYDDDIDIDKLKDEVSKKIVFYEVGNQQYGWLKNFNKYQVINRPTPSKLPPPPHTSRMAKLTEASLNTHGGLTPNIIEKKRIEYKEDKHEEISKEDIEYAKNKAKELILWLSRSKAIPK